MTFERNQWFSRSSTTCLARRWARLLRPGWRWSSPRWRYPQSTSQTPSDPGRCPHLCKRYPKSENRKNIFGHLLSRTTYFLPFVKLIIYVTSLHSVHSSEYQRVYFANITNYQVHLKSQWRMKLTTHRETALLCYRTKHFYINLRCR